MDRIRRRLAERRRDASGASEGPAPEPEGNEYEGEGGDQAPGSSFKRPELGAFGETGREALEWISELGGSIAGRVRAAAGAVADLWFGLSLLARRRIAAAAALLGLVVFVVGVVAPLAPCWAPGGDRCPPDDDAAKLVPADAGAYVHANLDPDTDQYEAAAEVTALVPDLTAEATGLLSTAVDRQVIYQRDIQPWSAGELAVALVGGSATADRLLLVEVADAEGAAQFAERVLRAGVETADVEGVAVSTDRRGLSSAITDGFLLIGPELQVRRSVELSVEDSIEFNPVAQEALEALPEERLVEAFVSADLAGALAGQEALGAFDTIVNSEGAEAGAAALSFDEGAVELSVRSLQDPERSESDPDFFAALPLFEPELTEQVGADALAYMGVGDPGASAATLVGQAADTAPDLFRGLRAFSRRLRSRQQVDLERDVLPLLEGEAALTVEPESLPGDDPAQPSSPGVVAPTGVPYLALLATGVDPETSARDLAELQVPLADAVDASEGQSPVFESIEIGGVTAQSLRLSRIVELTYATYDDELVVGTSPAAVERARADADPLAGSEEFERATEGFPDQMSMLLYFDFRGLLALGERLFLAEDPDYARFAQDLRTIDRIGIAVRRTRVELATDVRVTVAGERRSAFGEDPLGADPG